MNKRELDDDERQRAERAGEHRTNLRSLFILLRQHGVTRAAFHPDGQLARVRFSSRQETSSDPLCQPLPEGTSGFGTSFVASGTATNQPPPAPSEPAFDFLSGPADADDLTFASTPGRLVARSRGAGAVPMERDE